MRGDVGRVSEEVVKGVKHVWGCDTRSVGQPEEIGHVSVDSTWRHNTRGSEQYE